MEIQAFFLSLLILSIVSSTEPRSLETSYKCATTCTEPENLVFRQGYTYQYSYAATVVSSFQDGPAADHSSEISIQANAMIDVLSPCEMVLRVTDATIQNSNYVSRDDAQQWAENIQRHPLHFNFQDGQIPDVCASNDDPTWVLNIKKGILSALQVSTFETVEAIQETDVSGACESSYTVEGNNGNLEIVKEKNYNKCEDRDKYLLFSHFTPYNSESPRQSFIRSSQTCTQRVQRHQVQSSICEENHVFRPFSTAESGAQTTIRQSLQYNGRQRYYTQETLEIANVRRTNLIFESENSALVSTDISELQTLYSDLCTTMSGENYKQVGKDFIKMVFLLRRLDSSAIEQAYSSVTGACPRWEAALKGMFQDALQWCGSEGCVVFATRLIVSGTEHLPNSVARRWMTGMSLITKPTVPMLRGMMDVVQSGRLIEQSYLTAGTMLHRLCTKSSANCLTEPVVRRALEVFEGKLGVNCRTNNPDQKQNILLSLRALGNAGRTTAINTLTACSQEETNDMETRIAAVQSFRRMPCNTDRSALSRIVFDIQQDSEIRIASYLSVMKCPTPSLIQQIVILLDDEPIQQVSSFIWSHVNELLESNDPLKGYIKPMLLETEFAKKHDLDPRKYSRFYEASLFSEALNAGATVESSVVWSPKSFVPRSAELDLSVDVFGQAVNLLEIGGRVEGVEKLVQTALASDNFFKSNPLSELFMSSDDDEDDEDQTEGDEESRRNSRETDNARLMELRNEYKANLNSETTPNANWYLRVFGNEMYYQNTRSMQEKMAGVDINSIFTQLAMGGDYNYHDDTMLMNSAHVLPTGAGLPLTIAFNGSASIDVNANGNLDIAGLFTYPRNLGVIGSLNPRAVVLVTGSMSVDATVTKTGIATESSAVTSWTIGGRVSITNSQSVEVKIDAPYQRNTFFSFNHKLMKLNGEEEIDIGTEQESNNIDCSEGYIGQRLCVASPPNAAVFPMSGPVTMSAYTEKTDNLLDHYLLEGTFSTQYNGAIYPSELQTTLRLDTPGSIVNRETNIRASYNIQEMRFGVTMQSPETNILLRGLIEDEPLRKHVELTYVKNGEQSRIQARMHKVYDGGEIRWSASTLFQTPSKNVSATATAALNPSSHISGRLEIENLLEDSVVVTGSLEDTSATNSNRLRYRGNGQLTVPGYIDTGVLFNMDIKPQVDVFTFGLEYEFRGMRAQTIRLLHKRQDRSSPTRTYWKGEQKLTMTQYPKFNHHMLFSYINGPGQVESFIKVGLGRHSGHEDNTNFLLVNQTLTYNIDETTEVEANVNIEIPPFKISQIANLNHRYSSSLVDSNLMIGSYGIHFFVQDSTPANGLINKELRVEIPTPWGNLRAHDTIEETRRNVYALRGEFGVGTSRGLTMNGECDIENLADRKSITINVQDDLGTNLLTARSMFQFLTPSGYSWENSMESTYNNPINLNLRHEGSQQGGFESSFLIEHQPDRYLKASLDFENRYENTKRLARLDFKDSSGTRRYIELNASKRQGTINEESFNNVTLSFINDIPDVAVSNVIASAEIRTALSMNAVSAFCVYNDNEMVGVTASYRYEVQDDSSGLTNLVLNLRQGIRDTLSNSVTTTLTSHNTLSDGDRLTVSHAQGNVEKLSATIRLSQDMARYEGQVTQRFDTETYPENVRFTTIKTSNGLDVTMTYTQFSPKTITFSISKPSESSLELSWSHNDANLLALVPRSIEATLQWGNRASDNGKGIWLVSTMGRNSPFNAELMYFNDDEFSVSAKLQHQVREFLTAEVWVPQINGEGSIGGSLSAFDMRWSMQVDSNTKAEFLLNWQSDEANLSFFHRCEYLRRVSIPQEIGTSLSWYKAEQPIFGFTIRYEGTVTTGSLSETPKVISIRYFSNCSAIAGHFDIEIQRSATQSTVNLSITQNRHVRRASAGYNFDWSQGLISTHMSQNLYENEAMPNIPSEVRMTISAPNAYEFSFSSHYNDYFIRYEGIVTWEEESNTYVSLDSYSDNVWEITPDFTSRMEIEVDLFSSISILDQYTINEQPQRMIKVSLSYAKEPNSETRTISALMRHDEPQLTQWGVPENVLSDFSITPQQYGFQSSLETTINNKVQRISTMTRMHTAQYSLRFEMDHSIAKLEELGVFRHFVVEVSASPSVDDQRKSITGNGLVEANDDNYRVDVSGSMISHPEESQVEINTALNHNIMALYWLGLPMRTRANTNIGYSVLGGSLSGESSTSSTIFRTLINEDTGEQYEVENHINLSIDMQIFSYNVIFAGSHDFQISFLPNKVRYEIAASGSIGSSHVFHKSLVMSLALDDKTEVASATINSNPTDNSFTLAFSHNATRIYKFGIPGNMAITFRKRSMLDFDLGVVYDTSKKSIGFKFDYHGERNHLQILCNHNFDLVVETLGIPKRIGAEIGVPYSDHDAELEIRYIWGEMIKIGHATVGWNLGEAPSVTYNHHHNITTDDVFPRSLRMTFTSSYDNQFNIRIINGRKRMTIRYDSDKYGRTLYAGSVTITQNIDTNRLPRYSRYDVSLTDSNVLDLSVTFNREVKLHTTVTGTLSREGRSGSVRVENTQQFIEDEKFPISMNLYANGSISSGIASYVRLAREGKPTFTLGFKTGIDIEGQSGYVELIHSQKSWKKYIPKKMRADAVYAADAEGNQRSLTINVRQGKQRNEITLGSGCSVTDNAVYGRLSYTHNFDEYREQVPLSGNLNLLFEKTVQSLLAQANMSLDELFLTHSMKAMYLKESNALSTSFELLQDNVYLGSYNVHTIYGSVSSEWEDDILARIKTQYGDKTTDLQFATDKTTGAELTFSHTWSLSPHNVHIVLSKSDDDATLSVAIDGIKRQIHFSGNLNENQGELHFTHQFEESLIPNDIILRGSYRLTPDYYLAVDAIVDGQKRSMSVGYSKLEDGFHVTSTLLDDVTRSATVRQNMLLGGFSVDIDHDIPELLSYIPGSFGLAASINSSPRPNVTLSIRQEQETKSLTSQVDFNSLQFKLKHDFDFLPFPRSTSVGISGSTNPFQGSITLKIDQTERTISGTADPENMLLSVLHSIPELPLPNSMEVSVSGSSSPLSCGILVKIDGLDRTARASFDRANMRGRLQHTIPELDRLFSARDIVFQSKGSLEPISGELFVSVDGLERRVSGILNKRGRFASFHQNVLQSKLVPRNVTLSVKGSMHPLSGSIHLTVDDIERSIGTELNINQPFASLTHNIPEAEPYIPKHMSVSASFTDSSGSASVEFTRNERNQHVTLGVTANSNHIRAQLSHTLDTTCPIPAEIVVDISGSVEHKNATVYVSADQSFVSVGAEIVLGNDKWYGGSMEIQHNVEAMNFMPPNLAVLAKARNIGKAYETILNINGLENHDYNGAASLLPTVKAKRAVLEVSYDHTYNGHSRSMSGSILGSKKKGIYKLMLDGTQAAPTQREAHFMSSVQPDFREQYQVTFALGASHNIPELVAYGIPRSIQNGQAEVTVFPDRNILRGEANVLVDNQRMTYSFEWRGHLSSELYSSAFDVTLQDGTRNEAYFGEVSIGLRENVLRMSRIFTITDRNNDELLRNENFVATISLDPRNPTVRLHANLKELNDLGFPIESEISFIRSENDALKTYEIVSSFDDLPIHFKFSHKLQFHPFRLYLLAAANQSLPILVKYGVPTHLLSEVTTTADFSSGANTNSRIVLEYNSNRVTYTGSTAGTKQNGCADYVFEHNIPAWKKAIGYNKVEEKHAYTLNDNIFQLNGTVVTDDKKEIENYKLTFNTQTYEVAYADHYNNQGYKVDYTYNMSKLLKTTTISIQQNGNTLFLWHYHYTNNNLVTHFVNHLYGTQFDISYNASVTSAGYHARFNSEISNEEGNSTATWISEPYSEASLSGQMIAFNYVMGSKTLSSGLIVARNAPGTEGKFEFSSTNKNTISGLPKKIQVTANYDTESVHAVVVYGRKRVSFDFTFGKASDSILSEMSFVYKRIDFLQDMNVPEEITSSFSYTPSAASGNVIANKRDIVIFEAGPTTFDMKIRNLAQEILLSITGTYSTTPIKSVDTRIICQPFGVDLHFVSTLKMFESGTGNSTLVMSLVDNNNPQRIDFNGFVSPISTDIDFLVGVNIQSSSPVLPFNILMKYNSTWDKNEETYIGDFGSWFDDAEFSLGGAYGPNKSSFTLVQPWLTSCPVVTVTCSRATDSEGYMTRDMTLQWNTNQDSLGVSLKSKNVGINIYNSIHITQPSAIFGVYDYMGNVFLQYTPNDALNFGINSNTNLIERGLNVSYTGVLPQAFGSHYLTVDIKQTTSSFFPSQFTTIGDMSIGSTGTYRSDWRMTSQEKEVVVLRKNLIARENGASFDLLWKQALIPNIPYSYLSLEGLFQNTEMEKSGRSSLQIDSHPVMSGQFGIRSAGDSDRVNKSISVDVVSGPLSHWLKFRTASMSTWFKSESDDRQSAPAFSSTLIIDQKAYQVASTSQYIFSKKSTRLDGSVSISHPLDLVLFGMSLPRQSEYSLAILMRSKGSRFTIAYNNDRMAHPFKVTSHYRVNNRDVPFEMTTNVKFGPEEANDDITTRLNIATNDNGLDKVMTFSMQYPERDINGELVVGGVNSASNLGFDAVVKDYSVEEVKTWAIRLFFQKQTNIIELHLDSPRMSPIDLRGDLTQVIMQARRLVQRMLSEATSTQVRMVKGYEPTARGFDMYIGYELVGDATYTLHMILEAGNTESNIIVQTEKNFQRDAEVARATVRLADEQLIQLKLKANPAIVKFLQKAIAEYDKEISRKVNWLADNLIDFLQSLKTVVTGSESAGVNQKVDIAIVKVNALRDMTLRLLSTYTLSTSDNLDQAGSALENLVRDTITSLLNQIDNLKAMLLRPFTDLRDEYYGAALRRVNRDVERRLQPLVVQLSKFNAGELFIELVEDAIQNMAKFMIENGEASLIAARKPLSELLVVTETELIFNIPLQFKVDHFTPMPTFSDVKKWVAQSALAIKIDDAVNVVYSFTNHYYRAQAVVYMPRDELLPPFKGHSFVSGFRHFSTFDKKHFGFSSGCATSHILASDLRDGNFTVSVSYADPSNRRSLNSIEVIVGNRHVVISSDYKVRSNGRNKQLPLDLNLLSVMLEGNVIHVRRPEGDLDVACDFTKELCTVDVSPYYFGATAGLSGVYNNEPMDDFKTPSHEIVDTSAGLASSWEVSGSLCSAGNTYQPCSSNRVSEACSAIFKDSNSPMRSCFPLVDPEEFMNICRDDMCDSDETTKKCAAVHAYAYRCNLLGAAVSIPEECVICSDTNGNAFDATQPHSSRISGLDVVFVIEQGSCKSGSFSNSLRKFSKKLISQLNNAKLKKNRFHVVGYGGPGAHAMPHTFTVKGQMFAERKNELMKALKRLPLSTEQIHADAIGALSYAAQLPFRAGAKPIIVHLPCDQCRTESKTLYGNVELQLRQQGILFHHVPTQHISSKTSSRLIYGYDSTNAFSHANAVGSSSSIRQNKDDLCVPLATATGGSVWDARLMGQNDFALKLSRHIAAGTAAKTWQTCTCTMNSAGAATSICNPTS